ncbi:MULTISPECIES: pilus assembly protein TadG-related protein [unclassified Sphingobium]|uniref:pilus assembly protein TadG-related protein n=1 Tax=unclassified Sphingobium TaxID=2611147 RepID=UPI0035A68D1C
MPDPELGGVGRDMGDCKAMGKTIEHFCGIMTRLGKNQAGNTIAIIAAALVPLAGMVGGAVDISRGYLAQTRLQQACDAGVLAGRKVMGSSGVLSDAVRDEVRKYVGFNFPDAYLGSALSPTTSVNPTLGANDTLQLTVTTTVPTVVMRLFGKNTMTATATCTARNDYANIDIVLVLDVTGSMACKPERDASQCSSYANTSGRKKTMTVDGRTVTYIDEETSGGVNISRMQGLRTALANLQSQMATIESQFNLTEESKRKRIRWAIIPFSQMVNAGFSKGSANTTLYARQPGWFNTTGTYRETTCLSSRGVVTCTLDRTNSSVAHDTTWLANTWDGCIEEQSTSNSITSTSSTIPSTAYDLLFNTVPNSTATRWTVADPVKVGADASTGSPQYACPKPMREMQTMTTTDFNNYFAFNQGFVANGGTYLDLGILWAARLLSRSGNWASENPTLYRTFPVSRYVILMTDGNMDAKAYGYGAYAQEWTWRRVTTNGDPDLSDDNHTARMLLTCTAIKNMDAKIYTISFSSGSTLSQDLIDCSSSTNSTNPEFAYKADDSAELNNVFRDIGENIGSLRLSQ